MSAETRKVLEMLAEKKITAEEADQLLDKLTASSAGVKNEESNGAAAGETASGNTTSAKPRFLRIVVDKPGHEPTNIRMPLTFARSGSRFLAVLPTGVKERLAENGMDVAALSELADKNWTSALENINIDIDKGNGRKVKIFCE